MTVYTLMTLDIPLIVLIPYRKIILILKDDISEVLLLLFFYAEGK